MNATIEQIDGARDLALADKVMMTALREWYGNQPHEAIPFEAWVAVRCEDMADCIGENVTAENLVRALRVNAVGDGLALFLATRATKDGFITDTNCYVEDNTVFSSIWVSGKEAFQNKETAERIAAAFRNVGYAAEVWVDEENDTDCTVNAQIDFPIFIKNGGAV